jgi:DNA repair protein RadA/Sms
MIIKTAITFYIMSKPSTVFVCQECGSLHHKWSGKCGDCGQWNTLQEEIQETNSNKTSTAKALSFEQLTSSLSEKSRIATTINELDRVLGGGLVKGSAILIGGDPGIGKSTLLLQLVCYLSNMGQNCAYITGEESLEQIALRGKRLDVGDCDIKLLAATNVSEIIASISKEKKLDLVVIDSIQTMFSTDYSSSPGTVSQVKAAAHTLISYAKQKNVTLLIVGHVTKDGQLAGPKVLEHMVDTVLYFEGELNHNFRILRAVKNRFGGINEIGVFEMRDKGLVEVPNPSALFLSPRERNISGSCVFAGIEGTRPILVEIQALCSYSPLPTPRRSVVGWDLNRLAMIIAVLNTRYGMKLYDKEVYLNIVGGLKVNEPACDLAVTCALVSTITDIPIIPDTIIFGEIGLSGEVRMVNQADARLKEAVKLGFKNAIVPLGTKFSDTNIKLLEIGHVKQLRDYFQKEKINS